MRFRMIATYFAVIVTILVLMTMYIISLLSKTLYNDENVDMFAKANVIAQTVSSVWNGEENISREKFSDAVEGSLAGTNIRGVITNTSYIALYDTNKESQIFGKVFLRDVIKLAFDGKQGEMLSDDTSETKMMTVAVPVEKNSQIIGCVYLAENVENIEKVINSTRFSLIIFCVIICILIGMLSFGMSFIITSPIEEVNNVAREISKGNFNKRVKIKGHDEFAQMGETLNYMCDELSLLEERRRKFVSDASHELKTPMAGIKLICDTILSDDNPNPDMVKDFLSDMGDEVDRLTRIIERLLVLTKLDSPATELKLEEADILNLISGIEKKLTPMANAKDIVLYSDFHGRDSIVIVMDWDKIWEAVYNVVDNAIKYSPNGGFVHISADIAKNDVIIKVEDNGPGIPEEEKEHIFERFYRLDDSRTRDTGGTGLGLAIARETINMHGGSINVAAKQDAGSIFVITIPMDKAKKKDDNLE